MPAHIRNCESFLYFDSLADTSSISCRDVVTAQVVIPVPQSRYWGVKCLHGS